MIEVIILSSNGTTFRNNTGTTVLTCKVYQGNHELTSGITYAWKKDGVAFSPAQTGQTLIVTAADVNSKAVYTCDVTIN